MGISVWQLLIILLIVLLLFGTKRLKGIGSDLGGAMKGFRESMGDKKAADEAVEKEKLEINEAERVIDGEVSEKSKKEDNVPR